MKPVGIQAKIYKYSPAFLFHLSQNYGILWIPVYDRTGFQIRWMHIPAAFRWDIRFWSVWHPVRTLFEFSLHLYFIKDTKEEITHAYRHRNLPSSVL